VDTSASFVASEAALHEEAAKRARADDFGDPSYLEGLRVVLDSYDREARFTPIGRTIAFHGLADILAKRARAEQLLKTHPEVLAHPVERPIVITGLVRTGSTALHHLVGQDPGIQVIEYWLGCQPQPRPPRDTWEAHPDYRRAVAEIDAMYQTDPSLKAIHLMMADGAEECRHFLAQSFTDDYFQVNATAPSFNCWYEAKHIAASYTRHRKLLQLVGAPTPERRWVLKYPVHMKNLRALLDEYPDACIVWTHRDPSQVMSSYISLVAGFRAIFEGETDRTAIAREQLEIWAAATEHAIAVRRTLPPEQCFDLHFRDFRADPVGAVQRIYAHFDQPLSASGETALRTWHARTPREKHGTHRHSMTDVGLTRAETLDRFAAYMAYFDIAAE
jgi:hypothetical protein